MVNSIGRPRRYSDESLIEGAVALFWSLGYHATSVRRIESVLDLRPGSLYARFGSKEGLFLRALDRYAAATDADIARILQDAPDPVTGIGDYCRYVVRAVASDDPALVRPSCMIVRTLLECSGEDGAVGKRAAELLAQVEDRLTTTVARAQREGTVSRARSPRRLARLCQLQIMGLRVLAERNLGPRVLEALADDVAALLLAAASPAAFDTDGVSR